MGSIQDKLNYLNETKDAIKQAIITKGVEVLDTDTFRSYADKIQDITSSEISVVIKDLVGYVDAISNYVGGTHSDSTLNWYEIAGAPTTYRGTGTHFTADAYQPSTAMYQAFNISPNSCKMGGTNEFTLESVFTVNTTGTAGVVLASLENGGCSIRLAGNGGIYTQVVDSDNNYDYEYCTGAYTVDSTTTYYTAPLSKKIYVCLRYKDGITTNFCSTNEKFTSLTNIITPYFKANGLFGIGYNASSSISTSDGNVFTAGTISMCRIYKRCLSDEEVLQNYKYEKERYGITPFSLTINPTPSNAIVNFSVDNNNNLVIDGNTAKVSGCMNVTYTVSASGYATITNTINLTESTVIDVALESNVTLYTLTVNPTPSEATVNFTFPFSQPSTYVIDGNKCSAPSGTFISYEVSLDGYKTQSGGYSLQNDYTVNITLNKNEQSDSSGGNTEEDDTVTETATLTVNSIDGVTYDINNFNYDVDIRSSDSSSNQSRWSITTSKGSTVSVSITEWSSWNTYTKDFTMTEDITLDLVLNELDDSWMVIS